ncbi:MAG: restriction endonuclease subunit S [Bacteroidaceae bacterium]|nr:restriction endonuclease subunit S [Bacteroidaceae bacterium]
MDVTYHKDIRGINSFVPLSRYVNIKGGKRIPKGMSFSFEKTNYLYLRLTDIADFENINYDDLKCISEDLYNKLKRYEIKKNQIVFSIAGTIGRVFLMKNIPEGKHIILTENCAMLLPKKSEVLPEYVSILLNCSFVQKQIEQNRIQTTIPKIGLDRIGKIQIPVIPSLCDQKKIIGDYQDAIKEKIKKEFEAKQLLNSLDNYLLKTLYIDENINREDNKQKITKKISTIIGQRLDVSFYKDKFEMVSTEYDNKKLASLVNIDPLIRFNNYDTNMPISFVPMECIDEEYGMISETRETTISQTKGYTKFEENDLLWAKITPCMQNGKSAIARHLKNGLGCGSTEYFVMRPKSEKTLIDYIYIVLRHKKLLEASQSSFGGSAGQQRVSSQYLKSIMIPHPDISIQKKIVNKVYDIKYKAKQLQNEGNALLEETKQNIEKLIIG